MNFKYENQGTNTYLVYEFGPDDVIDTMSLGMLTNNSIPGFAPATFMQMDNVRSIRYNVSAKISVSQLFSGPVNKKRLVGVFSGIVNAMLSAEDYMLDTNDLLLDLDHIYTDVSTCETVVVCLPVMNLEHKNPDLGMFFKNIIFSTQFDQTENCDHVAQIINYLNSMSVISLGSFKEVLDNIISGGTKTQPAPAPQPVVKPAVRQEERPQAPVSKQTQPPVAPRPQVSSGPVGQAPAVNGMPGPRPVAPTPPVQPQQFGAPQIPAGNAKPAEKKSKGLFGLFGGDKEKAPKQGAKAPVQKAEKPQKPGKPGKQPPAPGGFAVPGQQPPAPGGFAVPGQQPPAPGGFAVPGQQPPMSGKPPVAPVGVPAQGQMQRPPMPGANRQMPPMNGAQQPPRPVQPMQPVQPVQPMPAYQPPVQNGGTPLNFGETTVLGGAIGETTVLGAAPAAAKPAPHLVRIKNNEKIPINKPVFRIGKERSYVDYFIGDNTAISRSHANIVDHDGEFFVVDTNSTNHTYVNGGMIASNTETKLTHGTKIRFANEEFEFKMY